MFPVGDDNLRTRTAFPIVNVSLIVINVIAFLIQLAFGVDTSVMAYGTIPYEITHGVDLVGSVNGYPGLQELPINLPVYVTLLTSMFMHGSWLHIGGNMLFLFIFGDNVEDAMGSVKYFIFYMIVGFAATFAQIITDVNSPIPGVGASGAIAGVMAAYLFLFPQAQVRVLIGYLGITRVPAIIMIGLWFVLQFFSGIGAVSGDGGVAYWAHIGGFIAGAILYRFFASNTSGATLRFPGMS